MRKLFNKKVLAALVVAAFITVPYVNVNAAHPTVDLGTAEPFAILAGTGITDVPTSVITGNVGLSPTTGAAITGLTCAEVTGTIYDVDNAYGGACEVPNPGLLTTAKNDLTAAFVDAAGRTPVTTIPTELGGTTLTDGTYDSASTTFQITAGAGALILDGENNSDAVFIFQMGAAGTGLTVGPGSTVSLINGAQACNVFWQLDTAAIDTTAVFKGTIMALNSITVANGANIEGRLLARNGNVTLISDTITAPTTCLLEADEDADADDDTDDSAGGGAGLPDTGIGPQGSLPWNFIAPAGAVVGLSAIYFVRKKFASQAKIK